MSQQRLRFRADKFLPVFMKCGLQFLFVIKKKPLRWKCNKQWSQSDFASERTVLHDLNLLLWDDREFGLEQITK
jgi:hypothetical protein